MIKATILYSTDAVIGFTVISHGDPIVCSAVSMLVINTINSIEKFTSLTERDYHCTWDNDGGYISFSLNGSHMRDTGAGILLDAMVLGLESVRQQYPKDFKFEK